jgi:hypothetical protein
MQNRFDFSEISARAITLFGGGNNDWDRFAIRCGAGFQSQSRRLLMLGLIRWLAWRGRLRCFEIFDGEQKIGQTAVVTSPQGHFFVDRLMILREFEHLWSAAFQSVLEGIGSGRYSYGSQWSTEPAREVLVAQLEGVRLGQVRPIVVQYVDFSQFANWDAYYSAISTNSKRNGNMAKKLFPDIRVNIRDGVAAFPALRRHIALRGRILESKSINFDALTAALSSYAGVLAFGKNLRIANACAEGRVLASMRVIDIGDASYYLDGGREVGQNGASWLLMINKLQMAYNRNPKGKFVMGYIDYTIHDEDIGGGLIRSRRSCKVVDLESSIFSFDYQSGADRVRPSASSLDR